MEEQQRQLTEIYAAYSERVYRYMVFRVGNASDAQDLTGDVFERVLAKLHSFDPNRGNWEAWLFTIARNLLRDRHRRAGRWRVVPLEAAGQMPARQLSPEQAVLENEQFAALRAALGRLSEREQSVIAMKYGAGMTYGGIGAAMHLSEKNASVIACRSLKKLRVAMGEETDP